MRKTAQLRFLPNIQVPIKDDGTLVLSCEDIEFHTVEFLKNSVSEYGYDFGIPQATPIDRIIEGLGLTIQFANFADRRILGMNLFGRGRVKIVVDGKYIDELYEAGTILVSGELEETSPVGRLNFTLAHEFGHSFYHEDYFNPHSDNYELDLGAEFSCGLNASSCKRSIIGEYFGRSLSTTFDWVEWQADYFASCLLMPRDSVSAFMERYFLEPKILFSCAPENFPLSRFPEFQRNEIVESFQDTYQVSRQAAIIRLRKLKYLE